MQIQFLQNVRAMRVHGIQAQIERVGDLFVGFAFGHQLQNFTLAIGEQFVAVVGVLAAQRLEIIFLQNPADLGTEEGSCLP